MVKEIKNSHEFDMLLNSGKILLVDFWAEWCGPCRMISPIIDELSYEYNDVTVCKIDVDICDDLAVRYKIKSVPTLIVFDKEGKIYNRFSGSIPKTSIIKLFKDLI
jgi:thioredoxin 1